MANKNENGAAAFRSFDCKKPVVGTAEEEWMPHATMSGKTTEWWYLTALLQDCAGENYFLFFTANLWSGKTWLEHLHHTPVEGKHLTMLSGRFRDYGRCQHLTYYAMENVPDNTLWDAGRKAVNFDLEGYQADWSYDQGQMRLRMKSDNLEYDLAIDGSESVWHKDKLGHRGMIQQGDPDDFSFYNTIMRGGMSGSLSYKDDKGETRNLRLTGDAYIDHQYGDFLCIAYEWTSLRFVNGARVHLYSFYNGRQEAVYLTADGNIRYFDGFTVKQNGYAKSPQLGIWVSHGWSYEFPIEIEGSKTYTVTPFDKDDFIEIPELKAASYSGPGTLVNDATGEAVGIAVNEAGDVRLMQNGPYGPNQH